MSENKNTLNKIQFTLEGFIPQIARNIVCINSEISENRFSMRFSCDGLVVSREYSNCDKVIFKVWFDDPCLAEKLDEFSYFLFKAYCGFITVDDVEKHFADSTEDMDSTEDTDSTEDIGKKIFNVIFWAVQIQSSENRYGGKHRVKYFLSGTSLDISFYNSLPDGEETCEYSKAIYISDKCANKNSILNCLDEIKDDLKEIHRQYCC